MTLALDLTLAFDNFWSEISENMWLKFSHTVFSGFLLTLCLWPIYLTYCYKNVRLVSIAMGLWHGIGIFLFRFFSLGLSVHSSAILVALTYTSDLLIFIISRFTIIKWYVELSHVYLFRQDHSGITYWFITTGNLCVFWVPICVTKG